MCARGAGARALLAQPAGRGRLVGVDWSDALSGARSFIRRYSWTFPNLRDAEGTVGNDYRLTGLPTTFVLDASGRIRAVLRGPQDAGSLSRAPDRRELLELQIYSRRFARFVNIAHTLTAADGDYRFPRLRLGRDTRFRVAAWAAGVRARR